MASAIETVTVFGGSGFLGRHVVRALAGRGLRVRVAVRRPDLAGHLQPLGGVGQIHAVQANVRYPDTVGAALKGSAAAVNLVGILAETRRQSFDDVHHGGARTIAQQARKAGLGRIVQISTIGAEETSPSAYARSKAAGERAVLEILPDSCIMRPSIIFGPEDMFFNRFAALARISPILPLIGGGLTRFQPVFVDDVAQAVALAVGGMTKPGGIYELGGPDIMSFKALMAFILETIGRKRGLVPVPYFAAKMLARILQIAPNPLLTVDQVLLLERDNVVGASAKARKATLPGLGLKPHGLKAIVPSYLEIYRRTGQFARYTKNV